MTLANQCAAEEVEKLNLNNIYRIHEKPSPEKVNFLIKSLRKPTDKILKNNSLTPKILNLLMKQSEKNEMIKQKTESGEKRQIHDPLPPPLPRRVPLSPNPHTHTTMSLTLLFHLAQQQKIDCC